MRAHSYTRFDLYSDAVLRDAVDGCSTRRRVWRINYFGIDTCAHCFQNSFAGPFGGQVDGARTIEIECDTRLVSGDQGKHYVAHIASGEIMRFKRVAVDIQTGLY